MRRKQVSEELSGIEEPAAKSAKDRLGAKKAVPKKKVVGDGSSGGKKAKKSKRKDNKLMEIIASPDKNNATSSKFMHLSRYVAATIRNPEQELLVKKLQIVQKVGRGLEQLNLWSNNRTAHLIAAIEEEKAEEDALKAGKGKGKAKAKKVEDSEPSDDISSASVTGFLEGFDEMLGELEEEFEVSDTSVDN